MEKMLLSPKNFVCIVNTFIFLFLFNISSFSQVPEGINYQAIARDTAGIPMDSVRLNVTFVISEFSNPVYSEIHYDVPTNRYGLFTLTIGQGTPVSGVFPSIDWGSGNKYLSVLIDTFPGTNFTLIGQPRPLMSVPYALYSKNAQFARNSGDAWKLNGNQIADTMFIGTKNNKDFVIKTYDSERIRVAANGNITISGDSADISSNSMLNIGTSASAPVQFKTNGTTRMFIDINGNIAVGTTAPAAKLDVAGQIKVTGGSPGLGKVLTSDADGLASWSTPNTGGITSFSADSLMPLFTTDVTNDTTTPHLSFSLSDAAPYTLFGNSSNTSNIPSYFSPVLASPLFQNQGTSTTVLHGNAAGNPSWGQIVDNDIANGAIDLTAKVTGILPVANGGSGATSIGSAGSMVYSDGAAYSFSPIGNAGQVLESSGSGAPVWTKRVSTITGIAPVSATTTDTTTYTISIDSNTVSNAGVIAAGGANYNKVWKTDASGNPGWRADSAGAAYIPGAGLSLAGNILNSVWTGIPGGAGNIYNNNSGNVGIGTNTPTSKLAVYEQGSSASETVFTQAIANAGLQISTKYNGGSVYTPGIFWQTSDDQPAMPKAGIWTYLSGTGSKIYMGTSNTFSSGITNKSFVLDQDGKVGIGTTNPGAKLDVKNSINTGSAGSFENTDVTNGSSALVAKSNSSGNALFVSTTGAGNAAIISVSNSASPVDAMQINTNGGSSSTGLRISHTGTGTAGKFEITNAGSSSDVFYASSNGAAGKAGNFYLSNASNNSEALLTTTNGLGRVAGFVSTNASNTSSAVSITTNGAGSKGLEVSNTGTGTSDYGAYATSTGAGATNIGGYFSASGATNNYAAIFANGNVGVGTTAPSSLLHVDGTITTGGASNAGRLIFNNTSNAQTVAIQSGTTSTSYTLVLPTALGANNSILYHTSGGNLGWTSSVSSLGGWATTGNSGTNASTNFIGTTDGVDFVTRTANTERIRVKSDGKVGLGTSSPSTQFHVAANVNFSTEIKIENTNSSANASAQLSLYNNANNSAFMLFGSSTNSTYAGANGLAIGATGPGKLQLYTNNTAKVTVDTAGNMGVGTTAPLYKLHVVGTSTLLDPNSATTTALILKGDRSAIQHVNSSGVSSWFTGLRSDNGGASDNFVFMNAAGTSEMVLTQTGNVGIGTTTPTSPLTINTISGNDIEFVSSGTNADISANNQLNIGSTGSTLNLLTNNQYRLSILNSGNVGVGTTAPASTLQVNGSTASAVYIITTSGSSAASYSLDATHSIIIIKGNGTGSTTLNLPAANTAPGRVYFIKNVQSTSSVSVVRSGSDTIDAIFTTLSINYLEGYIIVSDGTSGWHIMGKK